MPAAWYSKIRPDTYHVRWSCHRRRAIGTNDTTGEYICHDDITYPITVRLPGKCTWLYYTLEFCEVCSWLIEKEQEYDVPA